MRAGLQCSQPTSEQHASRTVHATSHAPWQLCSKVHVAACDSAAASLKPRPASRLPAMLCTKSADSLGVRQCGRLQGPSVGIPLDSQT
eukprot:8222453-Alexandrium_andersonii.AAC.1